MHPALQLQQLLRTGQIVMAPGAPDALTARLVQKAGFPAIYMTGFGATASRLGTPDIGLLTQTEMTTHARDMARVVDIPIIADADTGYGGPSNIHRTVREYIQAGVAAIHLEDQVAPKRCGQMAGIRLMDAQENVSDVYWIPLVICIAGFELLFLALVLVRARTEIRRRRAQALMARERLA